MTKTLAGWLASGENFYQYVQPGDRVDEALVNHWRVSVCPAHTDSRMVQAGEASHVIGKPTFITFVLGSVGWRYAGKCRLRETTEPR